MSTKSTIKSGDGYHLYDDWMDQCIGADVVGLRLDTVEFSACNSGVDVAIPRSVARSLGLIPMENPPPDPRDARIAEFERILSDPDAVHINMLRGTIARPSIEQVRHLYPEEFAARDARIAALEAERERLREALTEAADELDAYYTAEYPTDHPHNVRKLETAKAANPARAALQEPTDAPE